MKKVQDFDVDDGFEERRSLLPRTVKRIKTIRVARSASALPGIIVAVVLFTWWSCAVLSDISNLSGASLDEDKYYDFDDVRITFSISTDWNN